MTPLIKLFGGMLRMVYDMISKTMQEPESISYFALSIIISTLIIKIVTIPLNIMNAKNQREMARLQPEIEKLQKKYKNDPQTLAMKQQQLYKDANYSMLSGCLPMIIQLIVLLAFYRVFLSPKVYAFPEPGLFDSINKNFFFIENLDEVDTTMILPIIAAVVTFLSSWIMTKSAANTAAQNESTQSMQNTMNIIMPIMIFSMGRRMASGLVLYWILSNLFTLFTQMITNHVIKSDENAAGTEEE